MASGEEQEELEDIQEDLMEDNEEAPKIEVEEPPEIKEEIPEAQPGLAADERSKSEEDYTNLTAAPMQMEELATDDVTSGREMEPEVELSLIASMKEPVKAEPSAKEEEPKKKGPTACHQPIIFEGNLDKVIQQALLKRPPKHDYFGLVFSAQTKRPPAYYSNYFLPFQKQPLPHQHVNILGKEIPSQEVMCNPMVAGKGIRPSTVKVRWMLNIRHTVYKAEDVYAYLIRYGPIEHLYQTSPNSVIAVFSHVESAFAAVKDPKVGFPWDPLIITWVDPRMNNFGNLRKHASVADIILEMNNKA